MKGALNQLFRTGHPPQPSGSTAHGSAEDTPSWAWNVQQWKDLLNSSLNTASLFPPRAPAPTGRERLELQGEEMSLIRPAPNAFTAESFLSYGGGIGSDDDLGHGRRMSESRPEERLDNGQHEPIQLHLQALRCGILRQVPSPGTMTAAPSRRVVTVAASAASFVPPWSLRLRGQWGTSEEEVALA